MEFRKVRQMPYSDKVKQRLYQKEWVRRKRGSTKGLTGMVMKPIGICVTPDVEVSVTIRPVREPLPKERQLSQKGFNE